MLRISVDWISGSTCSHRARTINEWNKLSMDCVTASSVNMFKNKVSGRWVICR